MPNTVQKLASLLPDISSWHISDDDTFVAVVNSEYDDEDWQEYVVSNVLLAQLHPDFPVALRAQIEWTEQNGTSSSVTYGTSVLDNLALQQRGSYQLIGLTGQNHTVVNIRNLRLTEDGNSVFILASSCEIESVNTEGRPIPFVTTSSHVYMQHIDVDVLETQYPGWKVRSDISEQLGMPLEERIAYILEKPSPQISMPGNTFECV